MDVSAQRIGRVVAIEGARLAVHLDDVPAAAGVRVGALVRLPGAQATVYGTVAAMRFVAAGPAGAPVLACDVELAGEAPHGPEPVFQRGVVQMPRPGDAVAAGSPEDVGLVFTRPDSFTIRLGSLHQDRTIAAHLGVNDLLRKHFAVLGATGTGKSSAVALMLRRILEARPNGHVVLLDPHAEYAHAFGDLAERVDPSSLQLPCWLFNFEEIAAVVLGRTESADRSTHIAMLKDAVLQARLRYAGDRAEQEPITVDTPVPYRIGDLIRTIDVAMGKLDNPEGAGTYLRLKNRLEQLQADKRFGFMFTGLMVRDTLAPLLARLLRIPVAGRPLTVVDLSDVPSEVVDVVVSVLCRVIFDFSLWAERANAVPVLVVCEEAHRYIPEREDLGFAATRLAISRIAREGRKYGVSLALVTQRPSELASSVLSQCGTIVALRMGNETDQRFVAHVLPETARSMLGVLPALGPREAIVVGEAVNMAMRIRFDDLPPEHLPRSDSARFSKAWKLDSIPPQFIEDTIRRWRRQER